MTYYDQKMLGVRENAGHQPKLWLNNTIESTDLSTFTARIFSFETF